MYEDVGEVQHRVMDLECQRSIERSYIQTFPHNFIFEGSKTDLEQMIGNAVPVKLAEYVARCIVQYFTDKASKPTENLANQSVRFEDQFVQLYLHE